MIVFTGICKYFFVVNARWNPWVLRRKLQSANYLVSSLQHENRRLHKAARLGTRVVGCLNENEIHRHHLRMTRPGVLGETYLKAIAELK